MTVARNSIFEPPLDRPELLPGLRLGRNWHCGVDPVSSRDRNATLMVEAGVFPEPITLLLTLRVLDATPESPRSIRAHSPGHHPVETSLVSPEPVEMCLKTPVHARGIGATPLLLELDRVDSPALHNGSEEERILGLQIIAATVTPDLTFPLDFTDPATCAAVLREGWTRPEPGLGCWSLGEAARIVLPGTLRPAAGAELVFDASALPRPAGMAPFAVELHGDGAHLATWRAEAGETTWRCPVPPDPAGADCEISLTIRGAVSPAALGLNADTRELGLLLKRIEPAPHRPRRRAGRLVSGALRRLLARRG